MLLLLHLQHRRVSQLLSVRPEILSQNHSTGPHIHPILWIQNLRMWITVLSREHIIIQMYKTDSRHETVCEELITQLVTDFNTVSWFVWFVSKHSDCWTSGGKQVYQSKLHLNKYTFMF